MLLKDTPIRRKLMGIILLISGAVLLLSCTAFFAYELVSFRQTMVRNLSTLAAVISANSTGVLAFDKQDEAGEILSALKAEPHVVAASLYDAQGKLFSKYPASVADSALPAAPEQDGIRFGPSNLVAFQPVVQEGNNRLGTLYLEYDMWGLYGRFRLYGSIVVLVMTACFLLAYLLSRTLQKQISQPILALAETAKAISERGDYSVRATKRGRDELGLLTDAFNQMLTQIHEQDQMRSHFVAIVESSDEAIIGQNLEGTITSWNPGAEKIFGYSAEEVIGKPMLMLVPPDRTDEESEILFRIRRGQSTEQLETVRIRKDGTQVEIAATISPIREGQGGGIVGASIIAREITQLKRAEAEIQKLNQELEQRVANRTAQLEAANEELRTAKEVAEAATLAKGRFLATMSHEIRTPINGVIGMTGLLLQTDLSEEQRDYAETIGSSGENLLTVINDILAFSRVEAGKVELESITFSLRDCLGSLLKPLGIRADYKDLELIADIRANVPELLVGDPMRLRQVLSNLTDNAIKFTAQGQVVVEVVSESASAGAVDLHFSVADTGIGIPSDKQAAIFEPFAQVDNTTTRTYGGTGLGLAIASQLIHQMRGEIWMESGIGQGSTFHFTVPLLVQPAPEAAVPLRPDNLPSLAGLRALVVDDNPRTGRILGDMLLSWGMQPVLVASGAAALDEMRRARKRKAPFPLVLIDAVMPEMDGFTLAKKIHEQPGPAGARVMMFSSVVRPGASARARQLGIMGLLTKPVIESELREAVTIAITGKPEEPMPVERKVPAKPADSRLRILLVEDNAVNRKVALAQLRALGYSATLAGDGFAALRALDRAAFDVVLMDCHMPGMDGYEAAAAIRQRDGAQKHTWIVAMTADAMAGDRERCLAAGMDDYVSKPVRTEDLAAVLDRAQRNTLVTPIDLRYLQHLRDLPGEDGDNTLQSLLRLFLSDAPPIVVELRGALNRADAAALTAAAHSLKGSSGFFGARRLQELCGQIEKAGKAGNLESAAGLLTSLELQLQLVLAAAEAELKREISA
jgi:two-component system, sensor histidine kinase and response regulator